MVLAGSNYRIDWNNQTLGEMVRDESMVEDVEEGEISDTASVEEISEEDFNKQEVGSLKESKTKSGGGVRGDAKVWTMQDLLHKYPVCRGYAASGLYNLAWAQAVQNKPLNEVFVMDVEHEENSKRSSPSSSVASVNSKDDNNRIVIDDSGDEMEVKIVDIEKEERELEEGEIDLDSEPVEEEAGEAKQWTSGSDVTNYNKVEVHAKEKRLEKQVHSIREVLEGITVIEAEKSFEGVCSRLQTAFESLGELDFVNNVPTKDTLLQLSFTAVQVVDSVFCSMNNNLKEQNRDAFSRLLWLVKSHDPPLLLPHQIKEVDGMVLSLDSPNVSLNARDKDTNIEVVNGLHKKDFGSLAGTFCSDLTSTSKLYSADQTLANNPNMSAEVLKPGISGLRSKGPLLPLLDLHKDHDEDSLPSPTRETTPCFLANKVLAVGDGIAKPGLAMGKTGHYKEVTKMHPYETDALKAVSTYQQKFGRSSFFLSDRLPSPTPSEESGDGDGDGDIGAEVSSSSSFGDSKPPDPPILGHQIVSSPPNMEGTSVLGLSTTSNVALESSVSNVTVKASAKSRDPRLRFANSDVAALDMNHRPLQVVHNAPKVEPAGGLMSSRKQKIFEESVVNGPALKRQKNGLETSGVSSDVQTASGSGGWLEDTDMVGQNHLMLSTELDNKKTDNGVTCSVSASGKLDVTVGGKETIPGTVTSTMVSLPALLKDIAVNPTMLINLLKMGQQQRLVAEPPQISIDAGKTVTQPPGSNSILGAVPSVNVAPSNPSGILPKPAGSFQIPTQITPTDESGKIRMKPRDPRRVLHGNTLQRSGSMGSEQFKTNGPPASSTQGSKDNLNAQKSERQAETKAMHSQLVPPPDITRQFTKNLKNIADIISVSQAANPSVVSQSLPPQPTQIKADGDVKPVASHSEEQHSVTGLAPEVGVTGPRSLNTWGDVEHLFEGYDDQQKAAIQRERARRIEEQKKMFAARKLCLVLDLDHTLLNSAKFHEVDPVHDEILRKKEEQDREKPQRHLFRFPHMGMWTKLRPGIWNFLEKASKLYELHLYTMGNKLYATEMAKVLDPKGVLFAGRVISRGDDGDPFDGDDRAPKSKDLEGVLGMESAVVIIDDSVRVWPRNQLNLIVVERYTYFPCSRRQFGLFGPSLLEIDHDERPEEGTLASSLAVIERIHQIFFSHPSLDDVDVRNILAAEQRKILAGCRIVFSRVFPVGYANPQKHPLWQTAEQFGAVCTNQIDEHVTHVVANALGTDKVNWALSTGRFAVNPGWVEASALLYRRANELDFAIKP